MKNLMLVVMSLLALTACGSSEDEGDPQDEKDRQQIQACVNGGGDAVFTFDQYGHAKFIICDQP